MIVAPVTCNTQSRWRMELCNRDSEYMLVSCSQLRMSGHCAVWQRFCFTWLFRPCWCVHLALLTAHIDPAAVLVNPTAVMQFPSGFTRAWAWIVPFPNGIFHYSQYASILQHTTAAEMHLSTSLSLIKMIKNGLLSTIATITCSSEIIKDHCVLISTHRQRITSFILVGEWMLLRFLNRSESLLTEIISQASNLLINV